MAQQITIVEKPYTKKQVETILHPLVKKWFYQRFKEFSIPQLHGVIPIHNRENILVSAPTGATKTLTAFLSILNELVDSAEKGILEDRIYAVYVSPLKALNNDIRKNLVEPLQEIEEIAGKKQKLQRKRKKSNLNQKSRRKRQKRRKRQRKKRKRKN